MPQWKADWRQSFTGKLLATYLAAWLLTLGVLGASFWLLLTKVEAHKAQEASQAISNAIAFDAQGEPSHVDLQGDLTWLPEALPLDLTYQVADMSGRVHLASPSVGAGANSAQPQMYVQTVDRDHQGTTWKVTVSISHRLIALITAHSTKHMESAALAMVGLSILLLGLVLAFTVQRLLHPLRKASHQAMQIGPQSLASRLSESNLPSEMLPLVHAFNEALDRLEAGFRNQQRFLADAAHELKTPLALLRGQIEMGGPEQTEQLLDDVDHLARQVQQLLLLTEVSDASNFKLETIHLLHVAQEVLTFLNPLAEKRGVRMILNFDHSRAHTQGDRMALFVLLKNLLENALKFSPHDSTVTINLSTSSLTVRDAGPGIAPHHLPLVFERFWRDPERRHEGAGLGLAICKEIAVSHGWQLSVRTLEPGTEFTLKFG
jgi:two-component system, OmpR family, sensor histidine kinase QseC